MDVEGYRKVGKDLVGEVEDITLTIDTDLEMVWLEQKLGKDKDAETILLFGKDTAQDLIKLLQTWVDAE